MNKFFVKKFVRRFVAIVVALGIPFFLTALQPWLLQLPENFSLQAEVNSFDNFYDQSEEVFLGEQPSNTKFYYQTVSQGNFYHIEQVFDVTSISGEPIVSIQRDYLVDPKTGKHQFGPNIRDRSGYLFAPRMKSWGALQEDKSSFEYWHVNYDTPFTMEFREESEIFGLPVYVYESNEIVDQTKELSGIPGVGSEFRMELFVNIKIFIEPYTGRLISYQDSADAFFVDKETGKELYPWNSFRNKINETSQKSIAEEVNILKERVILINWLVLGFLVLSCLLLFFWDTFSKLGTKNMHVQRQSKIKRIVFPLLASSVLFLLFTFASFGVKNIIAQQRVSQFESESRSFSQQIQEKIHIYERALRSGTGLFAASSNVDRKEWKAYVDALNLGLNYPGMQGFGYATVVPSSTRQELVQAIRLEGFPEFDISPPGERETITSIIFLEPFDERNRRAFGYDMFSEPNRRFAMSYARDTGNFGLSKKITLLQEFDRNVQAGFLMYTPLYKKQAPIRTLDERRQAIEGYVYAAFRAGDFVEAILWEYPTGIYFEIYDGKDFTEQNKDDRLLFSFDGEKPDGEYRYTDTIDFGSRSWTITYHAESNYGLEIFRRILPSAIFFLGLVLSSLLFVILYSALFQTDRAVKMAQSMTKDLSALTKESQKRAEEAERLNKLMVGRELKMIELKKKIQSLESPPKKKK